MPDPVWQLLEMYLTTCNHQLQSEGYEPIRFTDLIGAVLTKFLLEKAPDIQKGFQNVRLEAKARSIPGVFTPDQLDAIAGAIGADLPFTFRADRRKRARAGRHI